MSDRGEARRVEVGGLVVDPSAQRVEFEGRDVRLTPIEFDLLYVLLEYPSRVLSSSAIGLNVWKYDSPSPSLITVHIANLRRKLRDQGVPDLIETVRGVGYCVRGKSNYVNNGASVGRTDELAALAAALSDVQAGSVERARSLARLAAAAVEARLWEQAASAIRQAKCALDSAASQTDQHWWQVRIEVGLREMWLSYYAAQPVDLDEQARWEARMDEFATRSQHISYHRCRYLHLMRRDRHRTEEQALLAARRQWELACESDSPAERMWAEGLYGVALLWHGEVPAAKHHLVEGLGRAERVGDVAVQTSMLVNLSTADRLQGDVRGCEALSQRVIELAEQGDWPDNVGGALGNLSWVALRAGHLEGAIESARSALEELARAPAFPFRWYALWPLIAAMAHSDPEGAIVHARGLLDPSQQALQEGVQSVMAEMLTAHASRDTKKARSQLVHVLHLARSYGYT